MCRWYAYGESLGVQWYHPDPWPHARSQFVSSTLGLAGGPAETQNSKSSTDKEQGYLCVLNFCLLHEQRFAEHTESHRVL